MKKAMVTMVMITLMVVSMFAAYKTKNENDQETISQLIHEYMDGGWNNYHMETFKKCLHPEFISLSIKNNEIETGTFSAFLEYAKKMRRKEPDGRKIKAKAKINTIKTMGYIGFAKFEVYLGDDLHGTDFMLFLKFEGEWKFVRGVSIHHGEEGNADPKMEKEKIKRVICDALVDGSGNYWDVERFKKGFHPVFTGLSYNRKKLEKDSFSDWERIIKIMKTREPEGHPVLITGKFPSVEVLGNIGFAEVKLFIGTKLKETVYLLLLKFEEGWKIVNKLDIRHFQKKNAPVSDEKKAVAKVIREAYVDGIQNLGNIEAIQKGFHPGFSLLYIRDNQLKKFLIKDWIESVKKRKEKNPDRPKVKTTVKFLNVDVVGKAATAKFELYRDSKLVFTDFMSLLKFEGGWKIVSKISHRH